jgi:acetylornithine deacetylase
VGRRPALAGGAEDSISLIAQDTYAGHLYKELGKEGIVCGPGGRYNTMPDERVDIVDYLDMIRVYMLTILDICEVT